MTDTMRRRDAPFTKGDGTMKTAMTADEQEQQRRDALNIWEPVRLPRPAPLSTAEILEILASDPDTDARRRLARLIATPSDALARLAIDEDAVVRCEVARNPSAPSEILERLAADPEIRVRYAVAAAEALAQQALIDAAD